MLTNLSRVVPRFLAKVVSRAKAIPRTIKIKVISKVIHRINNLPLNNLPEK